MQRSRLALLSLLAASCADDGAVPSTSMTWGLAANELPELRALGELPVRGGAKIVRVAQYLDGLPVHRGELRALVGADGAMVRVVGTPRGIATPRTARRFTLDEHGATARALAHVDATRATEARARQAWFDAGGTLIAAWIVELFTPDGAAWRVVLAGDDGRELARTSLVDDATFGYRVFAEEAPPHRPLDGPIADFTPHPTGVPDTGFPPFTTQSLVFVDSRNRPGDPWLPAGATETNGNNVDAYADLARPDGLSDGDFRATATANVFDHPFDPGLDATATRAQQEAAITQLFFTTNWLHDFWYDAGFTEAAGNAQRDNYGRGGLGGDPLRAEAQDDALAGTRNNANMATPSDGMSPRMQMYVFTGIESRTLVLSPSGRTPVTGSAVFAAREHDVTAEVVLAIPEDACTAITNDIAGKIALVQATTCPYEQLAVNVQAAGGVGALVIHHLPGDVPPRLGDDPDLDGMVTIPVFAITQAEGMQLRAELAAGTVTARMTRAFSAEPDSSLDTTIVAHEFGHFVHRRLTDCTTELCGAMSEGWGDFQALLFQSRAGDDLDGAYPIGSYAALASRDDPAYFGVRRVPYSTVRTRDPLTFRHMADDELLPDTAPLSENGAPNSEVHNAGEVWATMLWDAYVALQRAHPGAFEETRAAMAAYVIGGLLLTPPDATPTEGRDAVLAAAAAANPADAETMLAAFAARGMGSCAVSPHRASADFVGIVESSEIRGAAESGALAIDDALRSCDGDGVLDAGERGTVTVPIKNTGHRVLEDVTVKLESFDAPVLGVDTEPVTIARLAPGEVVDVTFEVTIDHGLGESLAGDLALDITAAGACHQVVQVHAQLRMNGDDVPAASATDKLDAPSVWTVSDPGRGVWTHVRVLSLLGLYEGHWHAADLGTLTDTWLASPPLEARTDAPLSVTFQHRYQFEYSEDIAWDGGVVEVTTDGGATWRDVTELGADPGYTHVLTDTSGNPLARREAYGNQSPAYPAYDSVTLDFGDRLAGQTFQLRFRLGTDRAAGAFGWAIDNLAFDGLVGTPFPEQAEDATPCRSDDDGGCCDAGAAESSPLALAILLLISRRRRAARSRACRRSR